MRKRKGDVAACSAERSKTVFTTCTGYFALCGHQFRLGDNKDKRLIHFDVVD